MKFNFVPKQSFFPRLLFLYKTLYYIRFSYLQTITNKYFFIKFDTETLNFFKNIFVSIIIF